MPTHSSSRSTTPPLSPTASTPSPPRTPGAGSGHAPPCSRPTVRPLPPRRCALPGPLVSLASQRQARPVSLGRQRDQRRAFRSSERIQRPVDAGIRPNAYVAGAVRRTRPFRISQRRASLIALLARPSTSTSRRRSASTISAMVIGRRTSWSKSVSRYRKRRPPSRAARDVIDQLSQPPVTRSGKKGRSYRHLGDGYG